MKSSPTKAATTEATRNTILLALSSTRPWKAALNRALDACTEAPGSASMEVLWVVELSSIQGLTERLTGEGWVTRSGSGNLEEALAEEAMAQGRSVLQEVASRCEQEGIALNASLVRGDFVESVVEVSGERGVVSVIVPRRSRLALSRLLFGSPVSEIEHRSSRPVIIVEEGDSH